MDRVTRTAAWRHGLRLVVIAAAAYGLFVAARGVVMEDLLATLRAASGDRLLLTVPAILLAGLLFRGARFAALLGHGESPRWRVPFRSILATTLVSQAANNVLPLRGGDLIRTRDVVRLGCPVATVALAQIGEKVVEGLSLVVFIAPLALADDRHRETLRRFALGIGAATSGVVLVVFPNIFSSIHSPAFFNPFPVASTPFLTPLVAASTPISMPLAAASVPFLTPFSALSTTPSLSAANAAAANH